MILEGRSYVSSADARYKFTSKEKDSETGLNYFGARYLDERIARWLTVDPSADNDPGLSPFNYAFNNPIGNIDPDGRWPFPAPVTNIRITGVPTSDQVAATVLSFTDLNDYTVISTWITRGDRAINFDSSPATTVDKFFAVLGAVIPAVSGSAVKKTGEAVIEGATKLFKGSENAAEIGKTAGKSGTDFVVTPKGEAIPIPDGAKGPTNPQKGSGMMYQGGSGGKGMDKKVTGVRIMDANKNQGKRVNYMNKRGQSVDPKTGKTISKDDPRGHTPVQE